MSLSTSDAGIHPDDTIVAVSSASGAGKRAIIRLSGPKARAAVGAVFAGQDGASAAQRKLLPGSLNLTGMSSPLPAHLYFFPGPNTYTGQDLAELHTIGSPPLVERLVADLLNAGARPARPGEFTMRAFLAGKKDLPQAEAVHAVIEAGTDGDLRLALKQLAGGVSQPLHLLRSDLLDLLADLEAALDFADEDIEFVGRRETIARIEAALEHLTALERQFAARSVSARPVRIALVGAPNAGKSSLFNALGGGDAIVSDIAGTTRDYLVKPLDLEGVLVELIDTAGWEGAGDAIAEQAQQLGREQFARADVIVWCVEVGGGFDAVDAARLEDTRAAVIRVRTKCDLAGGGRGGDGVEASARTTGGTDQLRCELVEVVRSLVRSPLAPSLSRCRRHLAMSIAELERARELATNHEPPEFTASALRIGIDELGEITGAVYTNDLLDRIFSRFCIGK